MDREFIAANARSRERLLSLINEVSDEELTLTLYAEEWTVAAVLAHIAFWDQRRLCLIRKWKKEGVSLSPVDENIINDALLPLLLAIPPEKAADLALTTAEAIDHELEQAPDDMVKAMKATGDEHALDRSVHRNMHLDEIEALLRTRRASRK